MYIRWLLYTVVGLFSEVLNIFIAPIAALFVDSNGKLPYYFAWLQTPDNPCTGDEGHVERWAWLYQYVPFCVAYYVQCVAWMYRNAVYGLHIDVLGVIVEPEFEFSYEGDVKTGNRPLHEGYVRYNLHTKQKQWFQVYLVKKWCKKYVLRINLGWKIYNNPAVGDGCQLVYTINPFMAVVEK